MSLEIPNTRNTKYGVFLLIVGILGLLAAFALTLDKFAVLLKPGYVPSCNVGILVSCSTNLASWQGSLFGFPNPIIGLMAWPVVITIGVAVLGGVRFPRWFWIGFNAGIAGALTFVIWLICQSIFTLGVLCPWCLLTWSVTIPLFVVVTLRNLSNGYFGGPEILRIGAKSALRWNWLITFVLFLAVILTAQLRLNAIPLVIIDIRNALGW